MRKFLPAFIIAILFTAIVNTQAASATSKSDEVLSIANKYRGVPYSYGGTTPSGFDCSGYITYVMNQAGVSLPRTVAQMYNIGTPVAKSDLKKGDLVFFKTVSNGPSHAGIYEGNGKFIHASTSRGVISSSINDPYYWGPRYIGAKRILPETPPAPPKPKRVLGEGEYFDVPTNHWAFNEIKELSNANMINGIGNDKFAPNDNLTRAQIATLVARAASLPLDSGLNGFSDVPTDHWAAKAIAATDRAGYFSYLDGDVFNPDEAVTREEVAVLFTKAFNLTADYSSTFADVGASNWAYEEIHALRSSGIVNGFEDGTYRPSNNITRAEFSKMLHTALN